jgi:Spy/CpxP family protein refolding chaperone
MRGTWIKNTVLLLGMTVAGTALIAQQASSPAIQPAPGTATQSASADTNARPQLSAEQKKQMRELRMSARDQAAIIRNDQTLNQEQKQAKLQQLRASTREQMKALLTPEQQTAMVNHRAERRAKIAAKLGLTSDQQSKMVALFHSTRQQRQSALKDGSLTNEQKQAQLSQIRQSAKTQLATILTPEQLVKFQEMRKAHRHNRQG